MKKAEEIKEKLNKFGQYRTPVLFVIDYGLQEYFVSPLDELADDIRYAIRYESGAVSLKRTLWESQTQAPAGGLSAPLSHPLQTDSKKENSKHKDYKSIPYTYKPVSKERYKKAFDTIIEEIKAGNTYLTNLTFRSKLFIDYTLEEIYEYSDAAFKLLFRDQFVSFSPERFVKIENDHIYTYPMKGTIDAKITNAKAKILANEKEMAEHTMVVDLLRNDLSIISKRVRVDKFRYVEKIKAGERELLQVSSRISGELESGWQDRLGEIIVSMLPAGSITGTPKRSTVDIIKRVEGYDRGYYSGVFGVFDGESVDSAVMIRFVEKIGDQLYYKSGGGITIESDWQSEYNEMCEKIYVPFV